MQFRTKHNVLVPFYEKKQLTVWTCLM